MSRLLSIATAVAVLIGLSACDPSDDIDVGTDDPTITDLAVQTSTLSTLVTALQTAELDDDLDGAGPFTVFAPNNAAFDALPDGTLDTLLANPDDLADLLRYHVVSGRVEAADLTDGQVVTTLSGESVTINVDGSTVLVNGTAVLTADVEASNGVVHIIGEVLMPPEVAQ